VTKLLTGLDERRLIERRSLLAMAGTVVVAGLAPRSALGQTGSTVGSAAPPFVQRGLPGPFHAVLKPLEGSWAVDKRIYIAVGSADHPAMSSGMTCRRRWFGGDRHLDDITEGRLGDGTYYRMGVLGFSTMDHRYEWVTFDALNANSMIYRSEALERPAPRIVMNGVFTDQGLLGEALAGKAIPMRTTVAIISADRHVIDLHFMPPGQPEVLIDHSIYNRA
jgi:hypothetical protein